MTNALVKKYYQELANLLWCGVEDSCRPEKHLGMSFVSCYTFLENQSLFFMLCQLLGSKTTLAITPHKCNHMDEEQEREEIKNV